MAAAGRVARIVIDSPLPQLDHLFDYGIPEALEAEVRPGVRVKAPLRTGARMVSGFVVDVLPREAIDYEGELTPIDQVVSTAQVLTPAVWALARRLADRSAGTASDILRFAVPPRSVRVEKTWLAAQAAAEPEAEPDAQAAEEPDTEASAEADDAARPPVAPIAGYGDGVLEAAVAAGERIAVRTLPGVVRTPEGEWVGQWAVSIAGAAVACWAAGKTAIVAVPDYRDLDQLAATLLALAPADAVVRVDGRQTDSERYKAFLGALSGPRIVIGSQSAVYAPAKELGLLIVWNDGDPLHAARQTPYIHTRDAALVRQEQQGGALILAGRIRSVEAQRLVELGWLRAVDPERSVWPKVILSANQTAEEPVARAARIPSVAWKTARAALDGDATTPAGPVLIQVARPGYAPQIACAKCGQAARCNICTGPLGQRRSGSVPSCGWCGALATNWHCDHCEHDRFRLVTLGSGRTAEELGRAFPGVRVIVADGEHPVQSVSEARAIVVATRGAEPVAAGGYRAVLLLDGERMLARETLGVAEDCLRWWSNAAGLAAPGAPTVLVGVSGGLARDFATGRTAEFAHAELVDRRTLHFPPAVRLASIAGAPDVVEAAVAAVDPGLLIDVLGPATVDESTVRSILRFEYAKGQEVATAVRGAIVRNATKRRKAPAGKTGYRPAPTLRVQFDDPEII